LLLRSLSSFTSNNHARLKLDYQPLFKKGAGPPAPTSPREQSRAEQGEGGRGIASDQVFFLI